MYYPTVERNDDRFDNVTGFETLLALSPYILIESGDALFGDCDYVGSVLYHILLGQYTSRTYFGSGSGGSVSLSIAAIVGIIVGVLGGITLITALVVFVVVQRRRGS